MRVCMYERTYISRSFRPGTLAMRLDDLDRAHDTIPAFIGSWDKWSRKSELPVERGAAGK